MAKKCCYFSSFFSCLAGFSGKHANCASCASSSSFSESGPNLWENIAIASPTAVTREEIYAPLSLDSPPILALLPPTPESPPLLPPIPECPPLPPTFPKFPPLPPPYPKFPSLPPPFSFSESGPNLSENIAIASPTAVTREEIYADSPPILALLPPAPPFSESDPSRWHFFDCQAQSSSFPTESRKAAAVEEKNCNINLAALQFISELLMESYGSSSRFSTKFDVIDSISKAAEENRNVNLQGLIQYISELLKASGGPSSSFSTKSDVINNTSKATAVGEENRNVIIEGLIQYISELPSSNFSTESAVIKNIRKATAVEEEKRHDNLEGLIQHISELLELVKRYNIPTPVSLLDEIGKAHCAAAGLHVVLNILDRFEHASANRDEWLGLLDNMYRLAKYVKELKDPPRLREGLKDIIQEAEVMIVESSIMCCVQIGSSKFSRFFSTPVDKEKLLKFQQLLEKMYKHMKNRFDICLYDASHCGTWRPPTPLEREYPEYAVGIEEPLKEVIKLLEWESEKNALAVMVHGFGGVGKSTLADAVFARLDIVGCKYSMVRLFDDITSTPNIVELQKCILTDLMMGTQEAEKPIPDVNSGQREIRGLLKKEVAFIYIDNVLDGDRLRELLPGDMHTAKKVRVLITAREKRVCTGWGMETNVYTMNGLPYFEAMNIFNREMKEGQIDSIQLNQIIEISGGFPKLLTVVARFISSEEHKQSAFRKVMKDKENLKGQAFSDIEHYAFACDYLTEMYQNPFLDICLFFKGWNWDLVVDILGKIQLEMLEKRALVSKDRDMIVRVHDVILMMGSKRAEGARFNFTNARTSQIEEFLEKDIREIKGLWLDEYNDILSIPALTLDSMSNSLEILRLGNSVKVKGKCEERFEKLVFFQGKVPHLPFNISQMGSNLRYMELNGEGHSHVFEISSSDLQNLWNLHVLRLINFAGLKKLPEELPEIIYGLRELTLSYCTAIEELPLSISKLQSLRVLEMDHCYNLRRLPDNFESLEYSLRVLKLQYCKSLKVLPENFGKFKKLKPFESDVYYSLPEKDSFTSTYDTLPRSCKDQFLDVCLFFKGWNWDLVADIVGKSKLDILEERALVFKDKDMNVSLHDDILMIISERAKKTRFSFTNASTSEIEEFLEKDIPGIQGLWLDEYKDPLYIPAIKLDSMSKSLRILRLGNSVKVKGKCLERFQQLVFFQGKVPHLPFNISQMASSLRHMELDGKRHSHVFKISASDFLQIPNLRVLRLINFTGLKKLPEELGDILPELRELTLSYCMSMKQLPRSISKLPYLRILKMDCCYNLMRLPQDFGSLSFLQELTLSCCIHIEELPRWISKLHNLRVLKLDHCYHLKEWPDFESLGSLQEITLSFSKCHEELPESITKLQSSKELKIKVY